MRKGIYKAAALILAGTMCAGLTACSGKEARNPFGGDRTDSVSRRETGAFRNDIQSLR